jgi:hypothetical protein
VGRWNFHTLPSAPAYASVLRRGQQGIRLHVRGARETERAQEQERELERGAAVDPCGGGVCL